MQLYMGLRATEITLRRAREIDDDAHVLWVAGDDSREGRRMRRADVSRSRTFCGAS
jgi:hypothetical protein